MRYLANRDILRHLLLARDAYLTTIFKHLPLSVSDTAYWNAYLKAHFLCESVLSRIQYVCGPSYRP